MGVFFLLSTIPLFRYQMQICYLVLRCHCNGQHNYLFCIVTLTKHLSTTIISTRVLEQDKHSDYKDCLCIVPARQFASQLGRNACKKSKLIIEAESRIQRRTNPKVVCSQLSSHNNFSSALFRYLAFEQHAFGRANDWVTKKYLNPVSPLFHSI